MFYCCIRPKLRLDLMYCFDIWQNQEDLELKSPILPDSIPMDKVLQPNDSLHQRDQAQNLLISEERVLVLCQFTELFKQVNYILLQETGGTSLSWYYKACLLEWLVVYSVPECNPCAVLQECSVLPWARNVCDCYLSSLSGVRYCVSGYLSNPRVRISPSSVGWIGGN